MKKTVLIVIGVLGLAACQKKSEDAAAPVPFDQRVPVKLSFVEPVKGEMPSQAQLDEVKSTFGNKSKMVLPPGALVFPSEDMTTSEVRAQEEKLKKEDPNSHRMLKEIHASCTVGSPKVESTFPKQLDEKNVKTGDVFSMTAQYALSARTADCPASVDASATAKMVVEDFNLKGSQKDIKIGVSSNGNSKLKILIKKPEYQKLLNSRGMIVDTEMTFMTSVIDVSGKVYASAGFSGSYLSLDKQVDYTSTMEVASVSNDKSTNTELILKAVLKYPGFQIEVVTHQIQKDQKVVESKVYLNGNKLDPAQEKKIFNNESPGFGVIKHNQVLNALK